MVSRPDSDPLQVPANDNKVLTMVSQHDSDHRLCLDNDSCQITVRISDNDRHPDPDNDSLVIMTSQAETVKPLRRVSDIILAMVLLADTDQIQVLDSDA